MSLAIMKAGLFSISTDEKKPQYVQAGLFDEIERQEREALEKLASLEADWLDAAE